MKEKQITIAIVGRFLFPNGDAASTRVLGIGKILKVLGYRVIFIGKSFENKKSETFKGNYEGFDYFNISNGNSFFKRTSQTLFSGVRTMNILKRERISPKIVIYYGSSSTYLLPFLKYRKKYKFKLITDIVEWYDPTHVSGGKYGPLALDVNYTMKKLIPKSDGVIAISSYLKEYYAVRGSKTIRIPILIDSKSEKWLFKPLQAFDQNAINLVYAGVPGKKDLINILIEAMGELVDEDHKIIFHMFGPTENQIREIMGEKAFLIEKLKNSLKVYGRVNQDEIPQRLAQADFSVLIRPNKRYANAGFPTKFVESLASGVPVIANLTSDLDLYLKDGKNGFIINGCDISSVKSTILKALSIDNAKRKAMKICAKDEATESFDYLHFRDRLEEFLNSLN